MKKHEHAAKNGPETKPAHDEVAKKAYAIYEKEGRPQGHAEQNWSEAEGKTPHAGSDRPDQHDYHDHHANMAADFRKRFWISLVLTVPILLLSLQKNPYSRRDKELRVDRPNVAGTLISSSSFGFGAAK